MAGVQMAQALIDSLGIGDTILTGDNWESWSLRAEGDLTQLKVWDAIQPGYGEEMTDEQKDKNQTARSYFLKHVGREYLTDIREKARARGMWLALHNIHGKYSSIHVAVMLKELGAFYKTDDMSMQQYCAKIQDYCFKIGKGGLPMDDKMVASLMLSSLPLDKYGGLIRSFNIDDKLTLVKVKNRLYMEEKSRLLTTMEDSPAQVMKASRQPNQYQSSKKPAATHQQSSNYERQVNSGYRGNNSGSSQSGNGNYQQLNSQVTCYKCNGKGHIARNCSSGRQSNGCHRCGGNGHFARDCPSSSENQGRNHQYARGKFANAEGHAENREDEEHEQEQPQLMSAKFMACKAVKVEKVEPELVWVWVADSGATHHMTPFREILDHYVERRFGNVEIANGESAAIAGKGTVLMKLQDDHGGCVMQLNDVYHVPHLSHNLISIRKLDKKGFEINIKNGILRIIRGTECMAKAFSPLEDLYLVRNEDYTVGNQKYFPEKNPRQHPEFKKPQFQAKLATAQLWHQRFGHLRSVPDICGGEVECSTCDVCIQGKLRKKPFQLSENKCNQVLELVHSDVMGKISPPSYGGGQYVITFLDDFSRYSEIAVIKKKSDAFEKFKQFQEKAEVYHEKKMKAFQTDNGGEYMSNDFQSHLKNRGILHRKIIAGNSQMNGRAERLNQTLMSIVRCLLINSNLPLGFWAEAVATANYVRNRCKNQGIDGKIPVEVWTGRQLTSQDLQVLKVFGCKAWAAVMDPDKLDPRAESCVFLGFEEGVKGYRLYNLEKKKLIVSRDVVFQEDCFPYKQSPLPSLFPGEVAVDELTWGDIEEGETIEPEEEAEDSEIEGAEGVGADDSGEEVDNSEVLEREKENPNPKKTPEQQPTVRKSGRQRKAKLKCTDACCYLSIVPDVHQPTTVQEAMAGPEAQSWHEAMLTELGSLQDKGTWEIVEKPPGANVVGCKWVFKLKRHHDGSIYKFKARLVARGFSQIPGVDYHETYSPVIKMKTIRLLMALSVENGWEQEHIDVLTAYLNSPINEVVYMQQPEAFHVADPSKYVCRLKKCIYGLKQAAMEWHCFIDSALKNLGLTRLASDSCVYVNKSRDLIVGVYVDDLGVWGLRRRIDWLKYQLSLLVEIRELGNISELLSLKVDRPSKDYVEINQLSYAKQILETAGMSDCYGVASPLEHKRETYVAPPAEPCDKSLYLKVHGKLLYLAGTTRPDLSYAVSYLGTFRHCPSMVNWRDLQHVVRYVQKTKDLCLRYEKRGEPIRVYCDASWASDALDRRSNTGFVVMLAGSPVIWISRKQRLTAISSVHSEFLAMLEVTKEVMWLRELLTELGQSRFIEEPCVVNADSTGAIGLSDDGNITDANKFMVTKINFLREQVGLKQVSFVHVPGMENLADLLTKSLTGVKTRELTHGMGLQYPKH